MAIRLGDEAPDFKAETTDGTSTSTTGRGALGRAVLAPARTSRRCARPSSATVAKLKPEFDKRNVKVIGLSVDPLDSHDALGGRHRGDPGRRAELPADRRPRPQGRRPLRHDPPERQRHAHRALGVRDRPRQEGEAHDHLPGQHRPQLRRDPARHRLAAAHRQALRWPRRSTGSDGEDVIIVPAVSDEDAKKLFPGFDGEEAVPARDAAAEVARVDEADSRAIQKGSRGSRGSRFSALTMLVAAGSTCEPRPTRVGPRLNLP